MKKKLPKLKIEKCRFVAVSEVLSHVPRIDNVFKNGDNYNFSWGDNNRSMVDASTFQDALDQRVTVVDDADMLKDADDDMITQSEWDTFTGLLASLKGAYIDLEN